MNNLSQHPCYGKCTNFNEEPCLTCLVQHIEEQEFKYGLAHEDAYVKCGENSPLFISELNDIEKFHTSLSVGGKTI